MHLGAQLPLLVRGIFYDGWRIAGKPSGERHPLEFATLVAADLPPSLARDALRVTRAVFGLLEKELDRGETDKIIATLRHPLRGHCHINRFYCSLLDHAVDSDSMNSMS